MNSQFSRADEFAGKHIRSKTPIVLVGPFAEDYANFGELANILHLF